jgi:flavin reductase (DIM6/NTAB) family NADH-FMN oxidoreductase RutF
MTPSSTDPKIDQQAFRSVMGRFSTGVAVVTFKRNGKAAGITVNSFLSVSADPPLVLVSLRRESSVNAHIGIGDRYGVSFLTDAQMDIGLHFAGNRIPGLELEFADFEGTPMIAESLAQIVARVVDVHPAGDHLLYIAQVERLRKGPEATPLIFYSGRYKQIHAHEPSMSIGEELHGW